MDSYGGIFTFFPQVFWKERFPPPPPSLREQQRGQSPEPMSITIAASQLQQRQRDQERVLRETQSFLAQQSNTQRRHDWEERTQQLIDQREVNAITQKLLRQEQDELETRKREMSSLHEGEMNGWKKTLQTSLEVTQEERMEQIREKAYELKAQREADRQAFVGECYERQWVDECDELREFDSKATLDRVRKDQEAMTKNKRVSTEQEQPRFATSLINKDESNEQAHRRQASFELKLALERQVEWKNAQVEDMKRKRQLEEKEQLRQLAMLEEKARQTEKGAIAKARRNGEEMLRDLRLREMEREKRKATELEQNRILLQHALDSERSRIQMEQAKKHVGKVAASKEVRSMRGEEATRDEKMNTRIDETRRNQSDRIAKISDDKMAAEADSKRRWMQEVSMGHFLGHRDQYEVIITVYTRSLRQLSTSLICVSPHHRLTPHGKSKFDESKSRRKKYEKRRSKTSQKSRQLYLALKRQIRETQRRHWPCELKRCSKTNAAWVRERKKVRGSARRDNSSRNRFRTTRESTKRDWMSRRRDAVSVIIINRTSPDKLG